MSAMSELDYLRSLLALARLRALDAILDELLRVLLAHTGAPYGYVEVLNERADLPVPTWRARARSDEHVDSIQKTISRGIIGRARIEGRTIATPSAVDDARFADLGSVREHEIGAVICSPFDGFWTSGAIYLQGQALGGGVSQRPVRSSSRRRGRSAWSPTFCERSWSPGCRSRSS